MNNKELAKKLEGCEQDDTPHGHVGKYCIYDVKELEAEGKEG